MELLWDGLRGACELLLQRDPLVLDAAGRSLGVAAAAVILAGLLGVPFGSLLARRAFPGRNALVVLCRASLSIPTVLIGLLCYGLLSRRGPLGAFDLLYTEWAIVLGEFCLAFPIVTSWTHHAVAGLDPRVSETAFTLGASGLRRWVTYLSEARRGITLAFLTGFARCYTELGIAMMVGGNIKYRTRTLTTATALETARGEFERGVAMSMILLALALIVTLLVAALSRSEGTDPNAH